MTYEEFHALIDAHIVHAKEKYPLFAHVLTYNTPEYYDKLANGEKLEIQRDAKAGNCAASTVLVAEVYEFFSELAAGNLDRAKEEGADVVAVIYRALEMLEERLEGREDKRGFYEVLEEIKKNREEGTTRAYPTPIAEVNHE